MNTANALTPEPVKIIMYAGQTVNMQCQTTLAVLNYISSSFANAHMYGWDLINPEILNDYCGTLEDSIKREFNLAFSIFFALSEQGIGIYVDTFPKHVTVCHWHGFDIAH